MINYDTSEAPSFELAPEGRHKAIISEVDIYNNTDGPDKLIVTFVLENGSEHKEFVTPSIMEGEGFRTFADLLKLVNPDAGSEGSFDEKSLEGAECIITIKHRDGKGKHAGKTFANVLMVESTSSATPGNPFSEEDKKKQ